MRMMTTTALLAIAAFGLAGCQRDSMRTGMPAQGGATATAMLMTATGVPAGRATATEVAGGLRFTIDATGLPPGTHGAHIHTTGLCDAPAFATAGGHWNPTGMKHGSMNPQGPHEGDLPNLIVGTDGRGTVGAVVPGATMAGLLDADGAAIVVHAGPDDLMTDPSGNSGGRIACGVFRAS
ncbi:superoxide dismutase family protein [Sphingomonas sp. GC_Shp_2]|uniref:superoxide dismutase family protein n=3 Tax=unclassified Sphingomonas TaxID=196159 RepID=UPI0022698CB3|nr:superoxide dismutase family protein [Sphingomonas sp. GC_Shp_2]